MLTAERREAIFKLIQEHGAGYVTELSQRFHVSPSTIRRDLEWLSDRREIQRTYGGAVALKEPASVDRSTHSAADRVGRAAADLIATGETVFIGPGSLCLAAARHLCGRSELTVITNSLDVAWLLYQDSSLSLVVTGGPVLRPSGALVGQLARQALETLRADRLIIEVAGVSPLEGLTSDHLSQAELLRPLIESVSQVVVVVAGERLGRSGAAWLGPVSDADVIITEREAPASVAWDLSETGVKVTLV